MAKIVIVVLVALCAFISIRKCAVVFAERYSTENLGVVTGMPELEQERLKVLLGH